MFGNFSLVNLRQQVMSPVAQRENPLSIKLESSKDFKKWLNRLRNHMYHVSNELAAYAETGNLSQASNEYNLSEQVRTEAINILSFALIELLKMSTQGRPHEAIFKETDENPYVTGKEILDMIVKKYDISNFRQDVQIWLPIHSASEMELPERATYAENVISAIFDAPDIEKGYISTITAENKPAFMNYKKEIIQRAKNFLLVGLSPSAQKHCLSFLGSQSNIVGEEVYARIQEVDAKTETDSKPALVAIPKSNRNKGKNNKDWRRKDDNKDRTCGVCGGPFHRLNECSKLKQNVPDAAVFTNKHSGMVAEHVVQMDNSSDRNLTFCATDTSTSGISKDEWILDSGCTVHVSHNRELFTSFKSSTNSTLRGVGGETHIQGYGDIQIGNVTLKDVAYAPDLPFNLLSVQKAITTSDYALLFDVDHHVKILDQKGYIRALASLKNDLYVVHFGTDTKHIAMGAYDVEITSSLAGSHDPLLASEKPITPETSILHARLGHPGINSYNQLASIVDAPKIRPASVTVCPTCSLSKGTINKGVISPVEYTSPLQLIQVDLCGPFRYKNYKSEKFFMTIRDAYSRYYSVVHLVKKSDAAQELIDWIQEVENYFLSRSGYKVGAVRTDNAGEFMGQILHDFFKKKGIQHQLTVPHSSFQNGAVERAHCSIEEKTRCLLVGGRVPPSL